MFACETKPTDRKTLKIVLDKCEKCKRYISCEKVLELCDKLYSTYSESEEII